jgi:hypothetical protein
MAVVPLSKPVSESPAALELVENEPMNWVGFAAGGTLVTAGTLHSWWDELPTYIDQVQGILGKVQDTVNEIAVKREALRRVLAR